MNLLKFHNKIKGYTQNRQPGIEADMEPKPIAELEEYKAAGKLENKVAPNNRRRFRYWTCDSNTIC